MASVRTRLVTTFRRRAVLVGRDLTCGVPPSRAGDASVRVALLRSDEVRAYAALRPDQPPDEAAQRLSRGHECFAVWSGDDLVHALWSATGRVWVPYLHATLVLCRRDVYHYDSFTRADLRNAGLSQVRAGFAWDRAVATEAQRVLGLVALENVAGLASARAKGFRDLALYDCLRLGPLRRIRTTALSAEPLPDLDGA